MKSKLFFIKAITPLHVGSGSDLGVVDLPIQREAHTGFPKIEASSLKGAIRSVLTQENDKTKAEKIFGTGDNAGELGFSDARILFFPVKSVKGVYAYITCPMVLERFNQDIENVETNNLEEIKIPSNIDDDKCIVFNGNVNIINDKNTDKDKFVVLEEYSFKIEKNNFDKFDKSMQILQINKKRLIIISDDNFAHFVKNSTEVITRIKIGENGVVDKKAGALFTEEYLPAESILYSLAIGEYDNFLTDEKDVIQIGGNSTLGKGIVELSVKIVKEEQNNG